MEALLFPIVKDGMLEQFKRVWAKYFVLEDTVDNEKEPGLMKGESFGFISKFCILSKYFSDRNIPNLFWSLVEWKCNRGLFVALGPKMYQGLDYDSEEVKRSTKGVPHRHQFMIDEWKNMLLDENTERTRVEIDGLRLSKDKKMCRYKMFRKSLSDIHLKTNVLPDKITCTPLRINGKYL